MFHLEDKETRNQITLWERPGATLCMELTSEPAKEVMGTMMMVSPNGRMASIRGDLWIWSVMIEAGWKENWVVGEDKV